MSDQNNGGSREEQITRTFNPNDHIMQIKNKNGSADYLPVQWRLVWFREQCPEGTIETEMLHIDLDRETEEDAFAWNNETRRSEKIVKRANGLAVFRAVVKDGKGGIGTGTKSEKAASFPDYIEKAETGAIGRALAALGYGTQFAPELNEEHRIVDSPVARNVSPPNANARRPMMPVRPATINNNVQNGNVHGTVPAPNDPNALATEQQLASIRKLCEHLSKPEPENPDTMSYVNAKALIAQLSQEYRQSRSKAS